MPCVRSRQGCGGINLYHRSLIQSRITLFLATLFIVVLLFVIASDGGGGGGAVLTRDDFSFVDITGVFAVVFPRFLVCFPWCWWCLAEVCFFGVMLLLSLQSILFVCLYFAVCCCTFLFWSTFGNRLCRRVPVPTRPGASAAPAPTRSPPRRTSHCGSALHGRGASAASSTT